MKGSKETYFLDTNVFMRALVRSDDTSFNTSVRLLGLIKTGKIKALTSSLVLAEIDFVLKSFYKFSKQEVIEALKSVTSLKNLRIQDGYDSETALTLFEKHNVKFVDALLASHKLILQNKAAIVSYDRDFSRLPCQWLSPAEVVKQKIS